MRGRRPQAIAVLRNAATVQTTEPERPRRSLVIGIGNPLRGDDGIGCHLAEAVGGLAVHQLTPELAAELARVERVLFVDAWLVPLVPAGQPEPQLRPVPPIDGASGCSHRLEPAELLALAVALYGAQPSAAQLLLPAWAFGHGMELSAAMRRQLPRARRLLGQWLDAADA